MFIKIEADIEIEVVTLMVQVKQGDTLGVHVSCFDLLPGDAEDELGLRVNLGPISVQEGHRLLLESLGCHLIEVLEGFCVKFLYKRSHSSSFVFLSFFTKR